MEAPQVTGTVIISCARRHHANLRNNDAAAAQNVAAAFLLGMPGHPEICGEAPKFAPNLVLGEGFPQTTATGSSQLKM